MPEQRRRFKQIDPLDKRLSEVAERLRKEAEDIPPEGRARQSCSQSTASRNCRPHKRMARLAGTEGSAMNQKPLPHVIQISSPDVSKQGSVILLELADEDEAIRVAQRLAQEIGRGVTVRNAKLSLILTIQAPSIH